MSERYCVVLRSKHTGEAITLGATYETREATEQWAKYNCCERCNYTSIRTVSDGQEWFDKHHGFLNHSLRPALLEHFDLSFSQDEDDEV